MSDNNNRRNRGTTLVLSPQSAGTANIIATTSNNLAAVCAITVNEEVIGETTVWSGEL